MSSSNKRRAGKRRTSGLARRARQVLPLRGGEYARRRWLSWPSWPALALGGLAVFAMGVAVGRWSDPRVTSAPAAELEDGIAAPAAVTPGLRKSESAVVTADIPKVSGVGDLPDDLAGSPVVALVIDDLGQSVDVIDRLGRLGIDLSYSVLPFEAHTGAVVERLRAAGREILLHLPMEAGGSANPGPGALYAAMSDDELAQLTERALVAVPGATGVNNHMGSRLSADSRAMTAVLEVLRRRGLFFLDSRTSSRSVAYEVAASMGMAAVSRQVFLDDDRSKEVIRSQFRQLLQLARSQGAAVAIGHPYPETLELLDEEIPGAVRQGVRFVPVSLLARKVERAEDS